MLKVSAFYLEKQKSFIPKKISFKPLSISEQKIYTDPIFSEGFDVHIVHFLSAYLRMNDY